MEPTTNTDFDVAYIADLARLQLTNAEIAEFQQELASVLGYVKLLSEVDVEGIEPTAHAVTRNNVFRNDSTRETLDKSAVIDNAPESVNGDLIKVPLVIGEEADGIA